MTILLISTGKALSLQSIILLVLVKKEEDCVLHSFILCFSSISRTSLGKPVVWARGNSLKLKEMETPSWEMWESDSKLSLQVKYYVLQMGVTVFEEADLVFCCSTSQKMKRKTSLPTLQDTGVAFASFPDHVSDIL